MVCAQAEAHRQSCRKIRPQSAALFSSLPRRASSVRAAMAALRTTLGARLSRLENADSPAKETILSRTNACGEGRRNRWHGTSICALLKRRAKAGGNSNMHAQKCLFSAWDGSAEETAPPRALHSPDWHPPRQAAAQPRSSWFPFYLPFLRIPRFRQHRAETWRDIATAHLAHLPSWTLLIHSASLARRPCILAKDRFIEEHQGDSRPFLRLCGSPNGLR